MRGRAEGLGEDDGSSARGTRMCGIDADRGRMA